MSSNLNPDIILSLSASEARIAALKKALDKVRARRKTFREIYHTQPSEAQEAIWLHDLESDLDVALAEVGKHE